MSRLKVMGFTMNRCIQCGVHIIDDTEVCPLCRCVVEEDGQTEYAAKAVSGYPDIRLLGKRMELVCRIWLFLSIAVGILCFIMNIAGDYKYWWSLAVIGGLAYSQLILFYIIENDRAGYRNKTVMAAAGGVAYGLLVDYLFGFQKWSLNYAVPGVILLLNVMILIVMFVNLRNWQSYLMFQIFMIACSGICILLCVGKVITNPIMSFIAMGVSCMVFLGTVIIGGRRASNELKRRFHV